MYCIQKQWCYPIYDSFRQISFEACSPMYLVTNGYVEMIKQLSSYATFIGNYIVSTLSWWLACFYSHIVICGCHIFAYLVCVCHIFHMYTSYYMSSIHVTYCTSHLKDFIICVRCIAYIVSLSCLHYSAVSDSHYIHLAFYYIWQLCCNFFHLYIY